MNAPHINPTAARDEDQADRPLLSIVIPVKDEKDGLDALFAALVPVLDDITPDWELLFVNDGSTDQTLDMLRNSMVEEPRIRIADLSRNFGKEAALAAGLHIARGHAVITMDADLQDPPGLIPEMVEKWQAGADMVIATRSSRQTDSLSKRVSASAFYRLFNMMSEIAIPPHAGDFRLFDRAVVNAYGQLTERNRFNKGLFAWLGFKQTFVSHVRPEASRDASRWKPLKLIVLGLNGIFSFSTFPIHLFSLVGATLSILSLAFACYVVVRTMVLGIDLPGYASLMTAIMFIGGINMLGIGLLGEYVGRMFAESKQRPLYIVRRLYQAEPGSETSP